MNASKSKPFNDYIYIRLDDSTKKLIKEAARKDGSNMTIWVRQLILRELIPPTIGGTHAKNSQER